MWAGKFHAGLPKSKSRPACLDEAHTGEIVFHGGGSSIAETFIWLLGFRSFTCSLHAQLLSAPSQIASYDNVMFHVACLFFHLRRAAHAVVRAVRKSPRASRRVVEDVFERGASGVRL